MKKDRRPAWQTALERDEELASSPTLCRLENRVQAEAGHQTTQQKVRLFTNLDYAAHTWDKTRRVPT